MMRLCAFAHPAMSIGALRTWSSTFIMSVWLRLWSVFLRGQFLGVDFCTDSLLRKTSVLRICCASPAAPLGDFCADSLFEGDFDFAHLLC
jgi:hypothetical protein